MLFLVIADSEVELVPPDIASHRTILRRAKRRERNPSEMLLDSNTDHRAMLALPDGDRRGRPDIAHTCLLIALDSILCREGQMEIHLHTRHDVVLTFNGRTRIPRSQRRFYGLMESILSEERGTDLIGFQRISLKDLCRKVGPEVTYGFSSRGQQVDLPAEFSRVDRILAIVGGFPKGTFHSPVKEIADRIVKCYDRRLDAWTVVCEILCAYRSGREA